MEKKYISPETIVMKVSLCQMIANSPNSQVLDKDASKIENTDEIGTKYRDNFLDSSNGMNALW